MSSYNESSNISNKRLEFKGNHKLQQNYVSTVEQVTNADKILSNIYDEAVYKNAVEYFLKRAPS